MALKSTIYKASLAVSDIDRNVYGDFPLTVACHPSETAERMMVRLLAFALNAHEYLAFGKGLSDVDEADLWQKDLTGAIEHWIEVGQPDEKAILKACGRADRVSIYVYSHSASLWWKPLAAKVARARNLAVWSIPAEASQALAKLAARNMQLQCTIQEGQVWVSDTKDTVQIEPVVWKGAEAA
jgi:uncharacterized protein YaeQ